MEVQLPKRRRFALVAFACLIVGLLASAPAALAVHSDQYDALQNPTSCPTDSPYLNDPAFPEVACFAGITGHTSITIGNLETEVNTPTTLGFALVPANPALQGGSCAGGECFDAVPGSTTFDMEPIKLDLPIGGHHGPHHFPFHPQPHGGHWDPWHGHGFHKRKLLHGFPRPSIEAAIETAGDLHAFRLGFDPANPTPVFRLPLKIHLSGYALGHDCYIGSNANPIELAPLPIAQPEVGFLEDPNGLPVLSVLLNGLDTASNTFSVPAAQGCGPAVGFGKHKHYLFDDLINSALGLPSPAGENLIVLSGSKAAIALTPGGGATLKAAFEAANAP
ncbi:MAG TPA: hypothetical protein VIM28_08810 [Solirubrobacterales bacterium]